VYKTIDLIFSIKIDEQSNKIIENIIKLNKDIVFSFKDKLEDGKIFEYCHYSFIEKKNLNEIFLDNSYSLHKLSHKSRDFNYFNIAAFHKLNELIIRILEVNTDEYLIKMMVKLFSK
jgi:hypothetical protein